MPDTAFGNQLIQHRIARGWSRQDLSDAVAALGLTDGLGRPVTVSAGAITRHENGNRNPRPGALRAYRLALGLASQDQAGDDVAAALAAVDAIKRADLGFLATVARDYGPDSTPAANYRELIALRELADAIRAERTVI